MLKRETIILQVFIAIFFCWPVINFAQNPPDSVAPEIKGIIKCYPLQFPVGELRLEYEMPVKKRVSLEFGGGYFYRYAGIIDADLGGDFSKLFEYNGLGLRAGGRYYISAIH